MQTQDYTFDENIVSDLHKDAYGFRPGTRFWGFWDSATDAEKQAEWDLLIKALERRIEEDAAQEKACIAQFEQLVSKSIAAGAANRETALRWIMDASTCNGDWEFLCYEHGLPYSYFRQAA